MTKAFILAAGYGTRMRPLTNTTPKPLLKLGPLTLIEYHLIALKQAGITDIVINVHHLADKIMAFLGTGEQYGVTIHYSHEKEEMLGVGGGMHKALSLLGPAPFLLISPDIFTDYSFAKLRQLAEQHQGSENNSNWQGHLVMVSNPDFLPNGDFGINDHGYLDITQTPTLTYAGFGIIHPSFLDAHTFDGYKSFAEVLLPAITKHKITAEYFQGLWANIGTPQQLDEACDLLLPLRRTPYHHDA